jgi:carbonic anhydrase
VAAAIEAYRHGALAAGHVPTLTCAIHPAVTRAESAGGDLLDAAIHANIEMVVNRLRASLVLGEALRHGALKIVGARYDLHSGVVTMT